MLLELVKNETLYNNRLVHIAGPLNEASRNISRKFSFSELYEIVGLSNILKCNIRSIYPNIDYRPHLSILNSTFYYDHDNASSNTICIFWTHMRSETYARANNAGNWSPNHFVPLVRSSNNIELQHDLVLPNIAFSNTVSFTFTEIRS